VFTTALLADDLEVPTDESIPLTVVGWGAVQEGGRNVEDLRVSLLNHTCCN